MQLAKKVLLALMFTWISTALFVLAIIDLIFFFVKDNNQQYQYLHVILVLVLVIDVLKTFWQKKKTSNPWLKVPTLIISLPLSIPFLIIDYLESRKKVIIIEKQISKKSKKVMLWLVIVFNLIITVLGIYGIIKLIPISSSNWIFLLFIFPVLIICGSIFLILSNFSKNDLFKKLSWFGLTFNWFYLNLEQIEQQKNYYFFKTSTSTSK